MILIASMGLGLIIGAVSAGLMRRYPQASMRITVIIDAIAIVGLWAWADAFNSYPATFGPFVVTMLLLRRTPLRRDRQIK